MVKGIVITGNRSVDLQHFDDPAPSAGEVVLAIRASGMCGTDLHRFRAAPELGPAVIAGHEPAGEVVAVGAGVSAQVVREGMRAMVHHYNGCMACSYCRTGWTQMCTGAMELYGRNAHGSHAPYMKVPAHTLIPLDDRLSFEAGAAIGCGTGTAWGALERMRFSGRETLAVFGQGPVGASATMIAAAQGARVIALDVQSSRLDAAQSFGAWKTINPRDGDVLERIRDFTDGKGPDMALETSGSSDAASQVLACLRPWGIACFVGVGAVVSFDVYAILRKQLTILTSWTMSYTGQRACAEFAAERRLNLDGLFGDRWRLEDAQRAFMEFDRQMGGKGVFVSS
jgi:D-arabinose 1-dehydrogenase-like Zn-dependent alcohol dehydrogenase